MQKISSPMQLTLVDTCQLRFNTFFQNLREMTEAKRKGIHLDRI